MKPSPAGCLRSSKSEAGMITIASALTTPAFSLDHLIGEGLQVFAL